MAPFLFVSYIVWLYGPYRHFKLTLWVSKVTSGGTIQWRNMSLVKIELIDLILQFVHYPFIIDITLRISFSMFVIVSLTFFENIYIYICWKKIIWCNLFSGINYFLVKKPSPLFLTCKSSWMEHQAELNESYMPVLFCLSNFEATSYNNLCDAARF